jgi:hypothetical protein
VSDQLSHDCNVDACLSWELQATKALLLVDKHDLVFQTNKVYYLY